MSRKQLLDAATLFKATRNVATKHAALRTHQLEAYGKTSSLAQAVKSQTNRINFTAKAASAFAGRLQDTGSDHSTKATLSQASPVPRHDSVQSPDYVPAAKQGLEQDHFYQRSEENSTASPAPLHDIGVKQESAKRYPLPDGSIPPVESDINTPARDKDSSSDLPRSEPSKDPLARSVQETKEKLEPRSWGSSSIPDPSDASTVPPPEEARRLQRQAEQQIPSQAAEPPPAAASTSDTAKDDHGEEAALGVGQERDVFYTPSQRADRVLSALPRVKLPKSTFGEQQSVETVSDEEINQDVFYKSVPDDSEVAVPDRQAIPQQSEPSEEMYSELFHSPKVAKMLSGRPTPVDRSRRLRLKGVKETPMESGQDVPKGDPESFSTRPTPAKETIAARSPSASKNTEPAGQSQSNDLQDLAADLAKDQVSNPVHICHGPGTDRLTV